MKKIIRPLTTIFVLCFSIPVVAQEQCASITCDCDALPTESWVKTCKSHETNLVASCIEKKGQDEGKFCSLHGPKANRLPLELNIVEDNIELRSTEEMPKLNNKVAVLYWAIGYDFDDFEKSLKSSNFDQAMNTLDTISYNIDELFKVQLEVGKIHSNEKRRSLAKRTWRDYSVDTLNMSSEFFLRAESILNTYDDLTTPSDSAQARDLGVRLMEISGKTYEQAGYAYASGKRHNMLRKRGKMPLVHQR